jgi:isoprenylcysteine carboxyl methyltransferase (ICMT) family protein YpbQ
MSTTGPMRDRTSGTYLLVIGGIVVLVAIVVLALVSSASPTVAWTVLAVDVALLAAMVVARFAVRRVLTRQWTLTICVLAASVLSLGALWAIGAGA